MPHEIASDIVSLDGHIVDSLTLSKVLDLILLHGGNYEISKFQIGATRSDSSHAEINVTADSPEQLESILHLIGQHGAARRAIEAKTEPAPMDGVFPDGFYSSTNLESFVRIADKWLPVRNIEMDCGIVIRETPAGITAECVPLHRVKKGEKIVVGDEGVRVTLPPRTNPSDLFSFMGSDVS